MHAFTKKPSNAAPYSAIVPKVNMTARNPNTAANRRASAGLNLEFLDQVPQRRLDAILWRYRHGRRSVPPPARPNASSTDSREADKADLANQLDGAKLRELRRAFRAHPLRPLPGHPGR